LFYSVLASDLASTSSSEPGGTEVAAAIKPRNTEPSATFHIAGKRINSTHKFGIVQVSVSASAWGEEEG